MSLIGNVEIQVDRMHVMTAKALHDIRYDVSDQSQYV